MAHHQSVVKTSTERTQKNERTKAKIIKTSTLKQNRITVVIRMRYLYFKLWLPCIFITLLINKFVASFQANRAFVHRQRCISTLFHGRFRTTGSSSTAHFLENKDKMDDDCNNFYDDFFNSNGNYVPNDDNEVLTVGLLERVKELRTKSIDYEREHHSPNDSISPYDVVRTVLSALRDPDEPFPNSGYGTLLRFSTPTWRKKLLQSIGAPLKGKITKNGENVVITTALGDAISRPNNQYGILVNEEEGDYKIYFPSDIVDYNDGRCWLECHLINPSDNSLMIILGWELERHDGAWMVNAVDWQDFRDEYRPGIGREEWTRVFG